MTATAATKSPAATPEIKVMRYVDKQVREFKAIAKKGGFKDRRLDEGEIETFVEEACQECFTPEELKAWGEDLGILTEVKGWECALTSRATADYLHGNPTALKSLRDIEAKG